jgi:hypothetical protein
MNLFFLNTVNGFEDIPEIRHRKEVLTYRYWAVFCYATYHTNTLALRNFQTKEISEN